MENNSESATQTALVMAYIVNGNAGTGPSALNEITVNEIISVTTVAIFPNAADVPTSAGDILLI